MNEMRWTSAVAMVAILGCGGSSAPPARGGTPVPPGEPAVAAPTGSPRVVASIVPENLTVDGAVGEWLPDPEAQVRVALGAKRLALTAELPPGAAGVSVAITSRFLDYPDLGWIARSGHTIPLTEHSCKVEQVPAGEGMWNDGKPHPPEVATACLALLKRHRSEAAAFRENFVTRLRLTSAGVTTDGGAPIAGAQHAAQGRTVEVSLPLSAAPAFIVAPVTELMVHASWGELPKDLALPILSPDPNQKPDPRWTSLTLLEPAAFSPHAELRELLFEPPVFGPFGWTAVSYYHPSEPETAHWLDTPIGDTPIAFGDYPPPRIAVVKEERALYRRIETLGDVEVGIARGTLIIVKKGGRIVDRDHGVAELKGVVRRHGQIHLFGYQPPAFSVMSGGMVPPRWHVIGIGADGKVDAELAGEYWDGNRSWEAWDADPEPFSDRDFHMFGMKGQRKGKPKTVRWVWHPEPKRYQVSVEPPSQRAEP